MNDAGNAELAKHRRFATNREPACSLNQLFNDPCRRCIRTPL
jgi:hypothetical protein